MITFAGSDMAHSQKKYKIKELYYTLQGEGAHTGRPSVFCRFTGCNLWSGREEDRAEAICSFCDTDFVGTDGPGGGRYTSIELVQAIKKAWGDGNGQIWCVFTGGEPMLQLDEELIDICHQNNIKISLETNGTLKVPQSVDWICVSPKFGSELIQTSGDELKLVVPQLGFIPKDFESMHFQHFSLQPMDDANQKENIAWTVQYCLDHPKWSLSLQTHKILGID